MNKKYEINDGVLTIKYSFTEEHLRTLIIIKANDGYVSFVNRDPFSDEDLDGNEISWGICDDLVEMGLLDEDEEAWNVTYELSEECDDIMNIILKS